MHFSKIAAISAVGMVAATPVAKRQTPSVVQSANGYSSQGCAGEPNVYGGSGRGLNGAEEGLSTMSIETCAQFCGASNYSYFGVEYGSECYCGNVLATGTTIEADNSNCTFSCSGASTESCGGNWHMNLYYNPTIAAANSASSSSSVAAATGGAAATSTLAAATTAAASTTSAVASPSSSSSSSSASASIAASTVATTTTAVSSSTASASAVAGTLQCPASNGTYFTSGSDTFQVQCYIDHAGGDLSNLQTSSLDDCLAACANISACTDISWVPGTPGTCYLKNSLTTGVSNTNVWGAMLVSGGASSSSTSAAASTTAITTSTVSAGTTVATTSASSSTSSVAAGTTSTQSSSAAPVTTSASSPAAASTSSSSSSVTPASSSATSSKSSSSSSSSSIASSATAPSSSSSSSSTVKTSSSSVASSTTAPSTSSSSSSSSTVKTSSSSSSVSSTLSTVVSTSSKATSTAAASTTAASSTSTKASSTSTSAAGATTTASSTFFSLSSCPSFTVALGDIFGFDYEFTPYYQGSGYTENSNNAGNLSPALFPAHTFNIAGTNTACQAAAACLNDISNLATPYLSIDLHYLTTSNSWQCTAYAGANVLGSFFNVPNSAVSHAYGFSGLLSSQNFW